MEFKDRLKSARKKAGLSQVALAQMVGVTSRTIQNYEIGSRRPQHMQIAQKLAEALNTTTSYLLTNSDLYIIEAQQKGGTASANDIEELVSQVTGMFSGGTLNDDALDGAMKALNNAYWIAKENNKKYAKKGRKKKQPELIVGESE